MNDYIILRDLKQYLTTTISLIEDKFDKGEIDENMKATTASRLATLREIEGEIAIIEHNQTIKEKNRMISFVASEVDLARTLNRPMIRLRWKINNRWGSMHAPLDNAVNYAKRWLYMDNADAVTALQLTPKQLARLGQKK